MSKRIKKLTLNEFNILLMATYDYYEHKITLDKLRTIEYDYTGLDWVERDVVEELGRLLHINDRIASPNMKILTGKKLKRIFEMLFYKLENKEVEEVTKNG